jgi:predicted dehydrogenase
MKQVTTAIIGCGQRGPVHGKVAKSSDRLRLLAVCDLDEERARKTGEMLDVEHVVDYHDLLSRDDLDSVIISTHTRHHGEIAIDAVDSGKSILVEKPLVDSVKTAKRLVDAAERAGVVGMVAYQMRFTELSAALKREAARVEPIQALFTVQRGMMAPQYFFPEHYGGVIDTASHTIHRALWIMEQEPSGVYATVRRGVFRDEKAIEFANMVIDYEDGERAVNIVTSLAAPSTHNIIQIVGRRGTLTSIDRNDMSIVTHAGFRPDKTPIDMNLRTVSVEREAHPELRMQEHFADLVLGTTTERYGNSLRDGMLSVAITEAAAESARRGERVELKRLLEE